MPKFVSRGNSSDPQSRLSFHCPGCNEMHGINRTWKFNEDFEKPTVTPSILVTGPSRFLTDEEADRAMKGEKIDLPQRRCHSYVTDGKIQFLSDCNHALAGQTVELPEWPYDDDNI